MMGDNQGNALSLEFIKNTDCREIMERIYTLYGDYLMKIVSRQLGLQPDHDDVSDCFNNIFLKLSENNCKKVRMFQGRASFKTYLVTVCRNLIVDYYRENSKDSGVAYMEPEKLGMIPDRYGGRNITPESEMIEKENRERMNTLLKKARLMMKKLTDHERLVIDLKFRKITYSEINRMTGDKNSAYTFKCALEKLKHLLGDDPESDDPEKLFLTLIEE